jgi:hypothetical protein
MYVRPITDTRTILKLWAMEHAKRYALLRNIEIAAYNEVVAAEGPHLNQLERVEVEDLFFSGGRDDLTLVVWEVQDGAGWSCTVTADFATGTVTVQE